MQHLPDCSWRTIREWLPVCLQRPSRMRSCHPSTWFCGWIESIHGQSHLPPKIGRLQRVNIILIKVPTWYVRNMYHVVILPFPLRVPTDWLGVPPSSSSEASGTETSGSGASGIGGPGAVGVSGLLTIITKTTTGFKDKAKPLKLNRVAKPAKQKWVGVISAWS